MTQTVPDEARTLRAARGIGGTAGSAPRMRGEGEDVAPFVTWLSSDEAAHVNGHVFHVTEGLVSLMNEPQPVRTITKDGKWTVEELAKVFPPTIGLELFNPAPAQPPSQ